MQPLEPLKAERAKILITVKTYPLLSSKHIETVCTAELREEGKWIRIYPVPFRNLDRNKRFKKYQWIEANIVAPSELLATFRQYYGPTMNAFETAAKNGKAEAMQAELETLFAAQNQSTDKNSTPIPATYLRVTVKI